MLLRACCKARRPQSLPSENRAVNADAEDTITQRGIRQEPVMLLGGDSMGIAPTGAIFAANGNVPPNARDVGRKHT